MNHDYAHCIDCTEDCPEDCFRAQLAREAIAKHWAIASWMHFKNTDECPKAKDRDQAIFFYLFFIVNYTIRMMYCMSLCYYCDKDNNWRCIPSGCTAVERREE